MIAEIPTKLGCFVGFDVNGLIVTYLGGRGCGSEIIFDVTYYLLS